jgi:hypothetical protein
MSQLPPNLEPPLLAALAEANREYSRADAILAELRAIFETEADPTPTLQTLNSLMGRISDSEAATSSLRNAWIREGRKASPALQAALTRQRSQLESTLRQVHELEQMAAAAKSRLAPSLDASISAARGHAAYGRTVERAERVRA